MPAVETCRGPVDTAELGFTLMHEHVITGPLDVRLNWPHLLDREAQVANAIETLNELHEAGVGTIVDLTTFDLGRDVGLIRQVALGTPVQIIVVTGVHLRPPRYFQRRTPDPIVELYVRDIEQGVADTGVKAGAIKAATETELTPENEFQLRAVALAHRATGVPIITHSSSIAGTGVDQQRVFEAEGVDLTRTVIGHSGDVTDLDYLSGLMDRGSPIGMDRFGSGVGANTEERMATIAALCERGYADRMVLSHDAGCYSMNIPPEVRAARLPEWNYFTIPTKVLPGLRERGVSDEQIQTMTVDNPRRIFERRGAY